MYELLTWILWERLACRRRWVEGCGSHLAGRPPGSLTSWGSCLCAVPTHSEQCWPGQPGEDDKLKMCDFWGQPRKDIAASIVLSLGICSVRCYLPCCADTQATLWKGPWGEEHRPASSRHRLASRVKCHLGTRASSHRHILRWRQPHPTSWLQPYERPSTQNHPAS